MPTDELDDVAPIALERCTGDTPECPHTECPDGWHYGDDLPCSCTPDCALDDEEDDEDEPDGTIQFPTYPCPQDPDGLHHIGCGCDW